MKNIVLSISCLISFFISQAQHQLIKKWETDSSLKVPESVLYDSKSKVLYVSNIDGTEPWGKDGKGSIGKVALDGKIIAVDWVIGLQAPKGMGLYKNKLYVADLNEVVVIDITKASIIQRIAISNAQGLNDITIDNKGVLYVSDSKTKKVHQINSGVVSLLLDSLKGPNGLLVQGNTLYILDKGGLYRLEKNKTLTLITNGMEGGTDGIENVKGKEFIVSCWAGAIWYINADGTKELLLDTQAQKINTADIGYDAKNRIIYVPTFWKNSVVAYEVK
jgi:dipeptidyl aminopeptidase/acylaminoacyl peptidase